MSRLGHVSGVTGWIILFPVTSLTLYLVIPSYPELSSHTRRRMGRPGQRQPPESRSVRVCGRTPVTGLNTLLVTKMGFRVYLNYIMMQEYNM